MNSIEQITVTKDSTLKDALKRLDQGGMTVLLLIDSNGILLRTITDGDIRRFLLQDRNLDDTLEHMEVQQPVVGYAGAEDTELLALMDEYEINQIPVVDKSGRPVGLFLRRDLQPRIFLSAPHMGDYEIQYVEEAFETNWIAPLGPNVDCFEKELAEYVGIGHAAALSSGTAAIHLSLRLLDIGVGDIVFCSSFTFIASANPILYQGAIPVFIDSEPSSWNMSPVALEKALLDFRNKAKKPKAIIVAHLYGQSADMERIIALGEKYDVPVIEDAAESMGAFYKGKHTGTFGKFGIFSFNGNKIITTSGGGMLISDDKQLIEKARFLSTQARDPAPYYEHSEVGYNYRMSNVLAGIGRGQLKVLDSRVQARRKIFEYYREELSDLDCFEWMPEPEGDYSNRWLSTAIINPQKTSIGVDVLIDVMAQKNIEVRYLWKPMHQQPLFKDCQYYTHYDEQSYCDYLFETGICLPSSSNMSTEQLEIVISGIKNIFTP